MNKEEKLKNSEMKSLVELLNKWNYEYYVLNKPSVSDSVYDENYKLLRKMERDENYVLSDSPSLNVGVIVSKKNSSLKIVRRKNPMLSIDNVNSFEGLRKFDSRVRKESKCDFSYVCELKIDGVSVSAIYENGLIKQLSTRGDGFTGEDVTDNVSLVSDLPQEISYKKSLEVRGEVYMTCEEFDSINEILFKKNFKALSSPRNAASGSLRTLKFTDDIRKRKLNFFSYQVLPNEMFKRQKDCLDFLSENNFNVSKHEVCSDINAVEEFIKDIEKKRKDLNFLIDGVVVKVNEYDIHSKMKETNKFPRWSMAYKFNSSESSTTIKDILCSVGKNGRISYVALVNPFYLDGSLIKKVTLHNYGFIRENFINISDQVLIKKSGDVIPQISKILKKNKEGLWIPSNRCPSCSSEIFWDQNATYQICTNDQCEERVVSYLSFCVSKQALNIKGISKSTIEKMHEMQVLKEIKDFYQLWRKKDILSEFFRKKTLDNIISAVEESRKQDLSRVISSFSIPLLSTYKAKSLSDFFSNDIKIFSRWVRGENEKPEKNKIKKILGEKTFNSFERFFLDQKNVIQLENLSEEILTN